MNLIEEICKNLNLKNPLLMYNNSKNINMLNDPLYKKSKDLQINLDKEKERNVKNEITITKLKERIHEMRKNYYKEQDVYNQIKNQIESSTNDIVDFNDEIHIFDNLNNFEETTQRFIIEKIIILRDKFHLTIEKLKDKIKSQEKLI